MSQFFNHTIDLTKNNVNKLANGLSSDIKNAHMDAENHLEKVMRAHKNGKNVKKEYVYIFFK